MKKFIKTVAAILALVMMFGSVSAFAAGAGEKLYWGETTYGGEIQGYSSYIYEGTLKEGENKLVYNEWTCCREFYAEKDGYYSFEYNRNLLCCIGVSERIEDGIPVDERKLFESNTADEQTLVYLEKGEHFVSYNFCREETENAKLKIEYQDIEITDLKFKEGTFDDLIFAADVWIDESSGETVYGMNTDATVVFSNGKEFEICYGKFIIGVDGQLNEGENEVTVSIFDYSEKQTLTVYHANHFIKSISITNLDKYLNSVKYYDGSYVSDFEDGMPETLVVTFNDGSKAVYNGFEYWEGIDFPNGRSYEMWIVEDSDNPDGKVRFVFDIAEEYFEIGESKVRDATLAENTEKLEKYIKLQTERIKYYFNDFLEAVENGRVTTVENFVSWLMSLCRVTAEHGGYAVKEIKTFCDYYIL